MIPDWVLVVVGAIAYTQVDIVLHEFTHAKIARRFGLTPRIEFDLVSMFGLFELPLLGGGTVYPQPAIDAIQLSHRQTAAIALGPLWITGVVLSTLWLVGLLPGNPDLNPFLPGWVENAMAILGVVVITGPSPPDWRMAMKPGVFSDEDRRSFEQRCGNHELAEAASSGVGA